MKTAKEWLEHLAKQTGQQVDRYEGGVSCTVDTQELIARDIEVMGEAARLVCEWCHEEPDDVTRTASHADFRWGHWDKQSWCRPCIASNIHDRIAELRKELEAGGVPYITGRDGQKIRGKQKPGETK